MSLASERPQQWRLPAFLARCLHVIGTVCNPYRPELHYMRGPGPKCRAKQRGMNRRAD